MKSKKGLIIFTAFFLVLVFVVGSHFFKQYESERLGFLAQEDVTLFIRDHSPSIGTNDAEVFLVEFFDPQCETCKDFYPFVKKILADHKGKIKLVLRYAPFHKGSPYVVKILEAARLQGKYWDALELLYRYQPQWASHHNPNLDIIWTYLPQINVDIEKIRRDMNSPEIANIIEQDIKDGEKLGVKLTPGFFINGKPLESFGYRQLEQAIEDELKN